MLQGRQPTGRRRRNTPAPPGEEPHCDSRAAISLTRGFPRKPIGYWESADVAEVV